MAQQTSISYTSFALLARFAFAAIALLSAESAFAIAPHQNLSQFQSKYTLEIDTAPLTEGRFQSILRFEYSLDYQPVTGIKTLVDTDTNDLGIEETSTTFVVGAPYSGDLKVYADGVFVGKSHYASSSFPTSSQDGIDGYPNPIYLMRTSLGIGATQIQDRNGQTAMISLDPLNALNLFIDAKTHDYLRFADTLGVSGALVMDSGRFEFKENLPSSLENKLFNCQFAGQSQNVSPLILSTGLTIERVQTCVPSADGLVPAVLIKNNPSHEPAQNIEKTNSAALRLDGFKTTSPLFKLNLLSSANCVGYAFLSILGAAALPENAYWVENQSALANYTLGTHPAQVLIASRFHKVKEIAANYYDAAPEEAMANDPDLKAGDLILFSSGAGYAHAGVIIKHGSGWWLEHKFEEGDVLNTPIANIHNVIPNLYTKILVYRANAN